MKRMLRYWMTGVVIGVLLAGGIATAALAQDEPPATGYSNVQVWVNPEYDDPSLLVMMQGTIVGATPPARVDFLVPTGAVMYSAGSMNADGTYTGGPPDRSASDLPGWDLISYTVTSAIFRVEYYDDIIQGQPDKTIDYEFKTYLPVNGLSVSIQQPLQATDFTVDPAGSTGQDQEGFRLQTYRYDSLTPADSLTYHISYYKTDNVPSFQQNTTGGTTGGSDTGGGISSGWLAFIIVVAVIAVVSVVFFMMQRSRPLSRADRRRRGTVPRRSSGRGAPPAGGAKPAGGARFCTNCGAPFDENAKFCRECGTPRR
jgi:hypothetical protein